MYKFDQADQLNYSEISKLYSKYSNMYLPNLYGKFSFGTDIVVSAQGEFLFTRDGKKLLDLTGGLGVANMGHNHPRILDTRRKFIEGNYIEIHKNYLNRFLAAASKNLSDILPKTLDFSFFCNSGAESVDGALKISYKYHNGSRKKVLKSDRSFHGKTIGAGSLSTGDNFVAGNARFSFQKIEGVLTYEFNNPISVLDLLRQNENNVYAIFIEPFSCSTLTETSKNFLKIVFHECKKRDVIIVFDEIYSGFAKCGPNFYMEKHGFTPDIVCLSKALGGGKSSISAYVSSKNVYQKSYGSLAGALMHSTTYNSFGEECATVIESTNILIDEKLSEKSKNLENLIKKKLNKLKDEFPGQIKEIRGSGTHFGILFHVKLESLQPLMKYVPITLIQDPLFIKKLVITSYIEKYYELFNVVTAFTSNQDVIWNISPAPITNEKILSLQLDNIRHVLKIGQFKSTKDFVLKNFSKILKNNG
jgi:putrescine aminotransferase